MEKASWIISWEFFEESESRCSVIAGAAVQWPGRSRKSQVAGCRFADSLAARRCRAQTRDSDLRLHARPGWDFLCCSTVRGTG